jgi:hypothetical protein
MLRSLRQWLTVGALVVALLFAGTLFAEDLASADNDPFGSPSDVPAVETPISAAVCTACKKQSDNAIPVIYVDQESENARVHAVLKESTVCPFVATPLEEVVNYLGQHHNVRTMLDNIALENAGIAPAMEVTFEQKGITLQSALDLIATQIPSLDYLVRDGVLFFTSQEQADQYRETRLYDVRSIVGSGITMERLIGLLQEAVERECEDVIISNVDNHFLLIRVNQRKHNEIADLLNAFTRRPGQ